MSTNAIIAYKNYKDEYVGTYVHWDGYMDGVGKMLLNHYNNENKAWQITGVGYISSLLPTIFETVKEARHEENPRESKTVKDFDNYLGEFCSVEYVYIYDEVKEKWFVKHIDHWSEYAPLNEFGLTAIKK